MSLRSGLWPSTFPNKASDAVKQRKATSPAPAPCAPAPPRGGEEDGRKSCAECRRLKAKCDRQFPCSNCRRRGCALVCPDGDLSCMQGKRLVLASTEQLHDRIAHLESALFQAHSKVSSQLHPLLAPEYLDGGFASVVPPSMDRAVRSLPRSSLSSPVPVAPTLKADASKSTKDVSRSSAPSFTLHTPNVSAERSSSQGRKTVESLLLSDDSAAPEAKREAEWVGESAAPGMTVGTVGDGPNDGVPDRHHVVERLRKILRVLPPREETRRRAKHFWPTSTWYQNILRREEFDAIYEPAVYTPTPANPLTPHKLACILMVLALDTYLDVTRPDEEDDLSIGEYWDGVKRCFDTRFGWAASVAGVQALALATLFVGFGWRGALASNFYWLRMMTSQAQQLGLHKEPHWSLPEDEKEFRRRVFHEMWTIDCLISMHHGQRTAIALENIEVAYPKSAPAFLRAKYEYMRHVKHRVIELGCRPESNPASVEQIAQVHVTADLYGPKSQPDLHCSVLPGQRLPPPTADPTQLNSELLARVTASMCHYKGILFLYRPSLRRLIARIRRQPRERITLSDSERQTAYATYTACQSINTCSVFIARTHPRIAARAWAILVQTFSTTVSMAALAVWCGPHLEPDFISSAYSQLLTSGEMMRENGSKRSVGLLSLLRILSNLLASRYPQVEGRDPSTSRINNEGEDMLFLLLGGQVEPNRTTSEGGDAASMARSNVSPVRPSVIPIQERPHQVHTNTAPANPATVHMAVQDQIHPSHPAFAAIPQTWDAAPLPLVHPGQQGSRDQPIQSNLANVQVPSQGHRNDPGMPDGMAVAVVPGQEGSISQTELRARPHAFYEPTMAFCQGRYEHSGSRPLSAPVAF